MLGDGEGEPTSLPQTDQLTRRTGGAKNAHKPGGEDIGVQDRADHGVWDAAVLRRCLARASLTARATSASNSSSGTSLKAAPTALMAAKFRWRCCSSCWSRSRSSA